MENAAALAKRARKGDKEAYGELYEMFLPEMYRYAFFTLSSAENARDAVQDAALQGFKSIGRLRSDDAVKTWFFGILSHVCKRKLREKYEAEFVDLDSCLGLTQGDKTDEIIDAIDLAERLRRLKEDEREIVDLAVFGGLNSRQISQLTGLAPGSVRSKLSRAVAEMRKEVAIK